MLIKNLKIGEAYKEPMEDSHTNGVLIYNGKTINTPSADKWYGFDEIGWGHRWLGASEIEHLVVYESKYNL